VPCWRHPQDRATANRLDGRALSEVARPRRRPASARPVAPQVIDKDGHFTARGAGPGNRPHDVAKAGGVNEPGFDRNLRHADPDAMRVLRWRRRRGPGHRTTCADARHGRDETNHNNSCSAHECPLLPVFHRWVAESYRYSTAHTTRVHVKRGRNIATTRCAPHAPTSSGSPQPSQERLVLSCSPADELDAHRASLSAGVPIPVTHRVAPVQRSEWRTRQSRMVPLRDLDALLPPAKRMCVADGPPPPRSSRADSP
jgi:hypothetical protein